MEIPYNIIDLKQIHACVNSLLPQLQDLKTHRYNIRYKWVVRSIALYTARVHMTIFDWHALASSHLMACVSNYKVLFSLALTNVTKGVSPHGFTK